MIEMAITSERVDPAAAAWPRAVRLLLDHRLYAVAVGLTETGQALMAAAHYARALEELRLTEPSGPSTLRVQVSGHGDVRQRPPAWVLDVGSRGGAGRQADSSAWSPPSAG